MTQFFPPARCHCGVHDWHSLLWQHEVVLKPPLIGSLHHRHVVAEAGVEGLELEPPRSFWPSLPMMMRVPMVMGSIRFLPFFE